MAAKPRTAWRLVAAAGRVLPRATSDALAFRYGRSPGLEPPIPAGGSGVPVDEFLTVAEVSAILKLNQMTVPNWIDQGPLNVLRSLLQA